MYVSWLKKKLFFLLCSHTHTNYLSQMQQYSTLSFLFSSPRTTLFIGCLLSLSSSLLAALFFFSLSLVRHLVATLTFAVCAAILFLYSSICGTPKNLIYIVFIYYPTDLHSQQHMDPNSLEFGVYTTTCQPRDSNTRPYVGFYFVG